MASIIRIKRSSVSGNPSTLAAGELAYSNVAATGEFSASGDRLYIGMGAETNGNAANHIVIGGKYFTDMMDHVPGVLTASSALIADSNKKLDDLLVDNLELNGNTISTTNINGNLVLDANGTGKTLINDKTTIISQVLRANGSTGINVFNIEDTGGSQLFEVRENGDAIIAGKLTVSSSGSSIAGTFSGENLTLTDFLNVGDLRLDGNTISSTNTNGDIILDANGTGKTKINDKTTIYSQVLKDVGSSTVNVFNVQDIGGAQLFEVRENGDAIIGGVLTVNGTGTSTFAGNVSINGNINVEGTATVKLGFQGSDAIFDGNLIVKGNTTLGDATSDTLTINARLASSIVPTADATYNLGSSSLRFNNGYFSSVTAGNLSLSGNTLISTTTNTDINISPDGTGKTVLKNVYVGVDSLTEYIQDSAQGMFVEGEGIDIVYNDAANTLTISAELATSSNPGVASFSSTNFTVTAGAVATNNITLGTSTLNNGTTTTAIAGLTQLTVDNIDINGNTISATDTNGNVTLAPNGTGTVDVSNKRITSVADPSQSQDAATKAYVDAVKTGLNVKDAVMLATTAPLTVAYSNGTSGVGATLTNAGTQAALQLDGVNATVGDRILVKDQAGAYALQNGIYVVTSVGSGSTNWVLTRSTDADNSPSAELAGGTFVFVQNGNTQADNGYVVTTNGAITLGVTLITWAQFSGAGQITAGDGLSKTGNTLNVNVGPGLTINTDAVDINSTIAGPGLSYNVGTGVMSVNGTADRITIDTGNDRVDIASTYVGQMSITTLGTVTTGTWSATTIATNKGGTGLTSYTTGDLLYASATDTLSKLSAGSDGKVLQMNSSGVPVWGDIDGGTY